MGESPVMSGFLLKKRRKKMQGMARRYFVLSPTGALSYSFNPHSPVRDSVFVNLAYVSASRKHRTIHIDSGSTVIHSKALNLADFDKWTEALKGFIGHVDEHPDKKSSGRGRSATIIVSGDAEDAGTTIDLSKLYGAVAKMTVPIQEVEAIHNDLKQYETQLHTPSPHSTSPGAKFKFRKRQGKDKDVKPSSPDDYFDVKPTSDTLIKQLGQAIAIIKAQHDILAATINAAPQIANGQAKGDGGPSKSYASRSSAAFNRSGAGSRASSVFSNASEDFYDAVPGEFVLEEEDQSDDEDDDVISEEEDSSEGDSSFTSVDDQAQGTEQARSEEGRASEETAKEATERRPRLPVPITGDEFSMLGMLRKNVGKDLSTISFPVTINEPLSAIQRIAEELEYSDLLHRAAQAKDSIERLSLVAVFAISGAAGNKYRSSRKPFNPLLGETYECIRPDKGFKFIGEKVSHHPPIMAFHADGKGWKIEGDIAPSQKFWGRSMEVFVTGGFNIIFPEKQERYTIRKPSSFVRNLVAGTKYLEVVGDLVVTNEDSGEKAVINFKEGSAWGGSSSRNKVEGKVMDESGGVKVELVGRWDEHIDRKEGKDSYQRLWQIGDFPRDCQQYYGLSTFAAQLNETTSLEKGHMAPTDSRLRPDQLALEAGKIDDAEAIKKKVEEKQRSKRQAGKIAEPKFFTQEGETWKFKNNYFETREKGAWEDPDIF